MAQIDQQAKIMMRCAHICSEFRSQRRRANQSRFIHIKVENFKFDVHIFFSGVITDSACCFQQLRIRIVPSRRFPFPREKSDSLRAEVFRLINRLEKHGLSLFAFCLINGVRIQFRPEKVGLGPVADLQMALFQNRLCFFIVRAEAFELNRVKIIVTGNCQQRIHGSRLRIAHPLNCANLEILVNGFFHL